MGIVNTAVRLDGELKKRQESKPPRAVKREEPLPPGVTGAEILDDAIAFGKTFLYMRDEMHDALVLALAASHVIEAFTTVPRLLAVAPEKQSGKTTLLNEVTMLGNNPWKADPTSFALRSKFNAREKPLVIIDEIGEYYGPMGLRSGPKDLNKVLLEGYAVDAMLSLSVERAAVDVSSYCMAAMGGLRSAVRADIWDRSIVWKMTPAPPGIRLQDSLSDDVRARGKVQQSRLHQWAREHQEEIKAAFKDFRRPHKKMRARLRQVWGPLYAIALVAGGDLPERCIAAFKVMALDSSEQPVLSETQMVLRDSASIFARTRAVKLFAKDIRDRLRMLPDVDLYQDLSQRGFALLMTEALGQAQSMDIGTARAKGYHAAPVLNAWKRLEAQLEPPGDEDPEEDEFDDFFEVTDIT